MHQIRKPQGFALLELLVVVAIIAVLVASQMNNGGGKQPETGMYHSSIKRSNDAACLANRAALRTSIEMFRMNNPRTPVTTENLQKAGVNVATCPNGGAFGFTAEGNLICSQHPEKK